MGCGCNDIIPVTSECTPCTEECNDMISSECVVYSGDSLPNLEIDTNQGINDIFEAIDAAIPLSLQTIRVVVPNASVLALAVTPYQLLPSPGTGKFYDLISAEVKMATGASIAFTGGGNLWIRASGAANITFTANVTALQTTNANIITKFGDSDASDFTIDNMRVNAAVYLLQDSILAFADGDGDAVIFLTYLIKDV